MKKFFAFPLAVVFVAACSDTSTAPLTDSDQTPSYAKPVDPLVVCSGCPVVGDFNFENNTTISAVGGSTIGTELQPGISGTADDPNVVTAPAGDEQFLGRFPNTRTQIVITTPGSTNYYLNFDLYVIGSWDGRGKQAQQGSFLANVVEVGYRCSATGAVTTLLKTTFSNQYTVQQDYPNAYLSGGYKAGTGSVAIDALGYATRPDLSNTPVFRSFGDATYDLTFSGSNPCGGGPITFLIGTSNPTQQSVYDESWGIDNVIARAG
jgi:hypothetical protein